ncbi:hypothetical protein EYZ11_006049 [Aspergillus tanneri]|uniref:Uncharacterized protein n=1 Tax=Aspergillus tanneri TaxID=1220188 RepID=A0A4V3UPB6_9EURO|nr:hypothetical protein EYZ11_006049 [Aspergillus tanneri]
MFREALDILKIQPDSGSPPDNDELEIDLTLWNIVSSEKYLPTSIERTPVSIKWVRYSQVRSVEYNQHHEDDPANRPSPPVDAVYHDIEEQPEVTAIRRDV